MTELAPILTIDGPSGAGKGAVSARCARALGWNVLDSGAVYRSVAAAALERSIAADDVAGLVSLCGDLDLVFEPGPDGILVRLDGRAVDERLRSEEVSVMSSRVAVQPEVRAALLALQRSHRRPPGLVADGRDMGTIVFPDAPIKVFLDASVRERANRRYKQLKDKGENVIFSRLFRDLEERDRRDRERAVAPTVPADDAVVVDSTRLNLDQVVERVLAIVRDRLPDR
ncbi:(d)CMP kinase [Wenzhouxiangella marina]|uniref:Cytidylate kinase n=1 Tax=Wenzhouxiangella marina TaxID=1579979 RepID=A0A0K0XVI6_9GAMM|nr:(d)CMP kinase [Wenzhouxiangella marina]AKS41699.1 Cytidylate kinase [Wenzhouxiangella marina]MBB6086539.1 cytidylate kinase [Wenzhouxiangella marina]